MAGLPGIPVPKLLPPPTGPLLPPRPEAPLPSDCCNTGCSPCVHDLYQQDMEDWKLQCEAIKAGKPLTTPEKKSQSKVEVIFKARFTEFQLNAKKQISDDTFLFTFLIENEGSLNLEVGQHIVLQQTKDNGFPITRQYTPVSELDKRGKFEILIKLYEKGKMSQLIRKWEVGDMIPWRGPFGVFKYRPNKFKRIVLLGAGTGIAPLYQVIRHILADGDDESRLVLFFSSKTFSDILLRDELLDYCNYWNFEMCHYLSNEKSISFKKYKENVKLKRLAKEEVEEEIQKESPDQTCVLICGTKSYTKDMINSTRNLNLNKDQVHKF